MAEEGTLGLSRASDEREDREPSKEELQRRMEEARESITQTVTEIKETVTNQYYSVKESVSEALDWRTHFRKRPIAFSVGALGFGFLLGYGLAGRFKGDGRSREDYPSHQESDVYARTGATPPAYEDEDTSERQSAFHGHSYAAQPITDGPRDPSTYEPGSTYETGAEGASEYRQQAVDSDSYSTSREEEQEEPQKPGLLQRFKGTTAYDRLQTEVASLGDRFMEELSSTAQNVVLPALFNKIKELFGADLSGKKSQGQQAQPQTSSSSGNRTAQTDTNTPSATARAAGASAAPAPGSSSYATSENRGYGTKDSEATGNKSGSDSILDLDR